MELLPETQEAIDEFGPFGVDDDLRDDLLRCASVIRTLVPSCVGLSVASLEHGVTFTVEATSAEIALLDGVQYLEGGPCDRAAHEGEVVEYHDDDPTDEAHWQLFARSSAARNIASTLTLPLVKGAELVGTVNLYASGPRAFDGRHEQVAAVFGAWAPGAVTNADLDFDTRQTARHAPDVLRDQVVVLQAVGILMTRHGIDAGAAQDRVEQAALRAGVDPTQIAREIIDTVGHD